MADKNRNTQVPLHNQNSYESYSPLFSLSGFQKFVGASLLVSGASLFWLFNYRYKVSRADQWVQKTGLFIKGVEIRKKTFILPFQKYSFINLSPFTLNFTVAAMSNEKLEFGLPVVLTIAPKNQQDSLIKYATTVHSLPPPELNNLIKGLIEGQVRALAANVKIEDIFLGRNKFKAELFDNVAVHLEQFGLKIHNGNIEQLSDSKGSGYFTYLSQRIQSEAENTAKVEVAEQNKIGNIGKAERQAETRMRIANISAQAIQVENENTQKIEVSKANLSKLQAEQRFIIQKAELEAKNRAESLKMELEKEVQLKKAEQQVQLLRAQNFSKATVEAEVQKREAEGIASAIRVKADADLYQKQKTYEADLFKQMKIAEGKLYMATKEAEAAGKEAEALQKKAQAMQKLMMAYGGAHNYIMSRMVDQQLLVKLAAENSKAIQGLSPKITVWSGDGNDAMSPIKNLAKNIIPAMDIIKDQTGYSFPDWLVKKQPTQASLATISSESTVVSKPQNK